MLKAFLDILFPPVCVLCSARAKGKGFCPSCAALLEKQRISGPVCTLCGTPFPSTRGVDHACGRCVDEKPAFAAARSAFIYEDRVLDAMHRFKYGGDISLAGPLARTMLDTLPSSGPFLVVPVPLHPGRLKERGFNQSLLIARELTRLTGFQLEFRRLKRARDTDQQVGLKAVERKRNVSGAFTLTDAAMFGGKKTLLVDDVVTTGATLNECARVLRGAGAEVFAVTVARAVRL